MRYPMSHEAAKAIMEDAERRRVARAERKAQKAAQGPAQARAHWRWPMGIGAHAIALCVLAAVAALGYWLTH